MTRQIVIAMVLVFAGLLGEIMPALADEPPVDAGDVFVHDAVITVEVGEQQVFPVGAAGDALLTVADAPKDAEKTSGAPEAEKEKRADKGAQDTEADKKATEKKHKSEKKPKAEQKGAGEKGKKKRAAKVDAEEKKKVKEEEGEEAGGEEAAPAPAAAGDLGIFGRLIFGAVVPQANVNDDALKAQANQIAMQIRPMLIVELSFVRLVCGEDLTPEQRQQVKAAAEESLQDACRRLARFQFQRQGVFTQQPNPQKIISRGITAALAEVLPNDRLQQYVEESVKRQQRRHEASVAAGVSCLDSLLRLNPEQREKIHESLLKWNGDVDGWLMLSNYEGQYAPQIPDNFVVPHLTGEQKIVWDGLQKVNFGSNWGHNGLIPVVDDEWWGEPVAPQPPAGGGVGNMGFIRLNVEN